VVRGAAHGEKRATQLTEALCPYCGVHHVDKPSRIDDGVAVRVASTAKDAQLRCVGDVTAEITTCWILPALEEDGWVRVHQSTGDFLDEAASRLVIRDLSADHQMLERLGPLMTKIAPGQHPLNQPGRGRVIHVDDQLETATVHLLSASDLILHPDLTLTRIPHRARSIQRYPRRASLDSPSHTAVALRHSLGPVFGLSSYPPSILTTMNETTETSAPGSTGATLTQLAQGVESLRSAEAPPAWAEITGPLERPSHVRWHPDLDTLIGFVAPVDCQAIVAVGSGWARNLATPAPSGEALLAPGERRRCRVVCLMTSVGEMAGYLRVGSELLIDEPPTAGRVPDLIRRAFRLPTPPPEESTDAFLAHMWLANILGAGRPSRPLLSWKTVVGLHPAMQVAAGGDMGVVVDDNLGACLRKAAEAWSWAFLAQQATEPGWLRNLLPEGAAGWMDEGILSRWLLNSLAGVDSVVPRISPLITPVAAMRLKATLNQLGVLPAD
jgi:hypothetical protein